MSRLRSQVRAWWPVIAYAGLMLAVSSIPQRALPEASHALNDKLVHFVEYGVLGALLLRGLYVGHPRMAATRALVIAAGAAAGFGVLDEWYQSFTPGRESSGWDLAADTAGGICGAALALVGYRGMALVRSRGMEPTRQEERYGHGSKVRNEGPAGR